MNDIGPTDCRNCGAPLSPGAKFCRACGSPVGPAPPGGGGGTEPPDGRGPSTRVLAAIIAVSIVVIGVGAVILLTRGSSSGSGSTSGTQVADTGSSTQTKSVPLISLTASGTGTSPGTGTAQGTGTAPGTGTTQGTGTQGTGTQGTGTQGTQTQGTTTTTSTSTTRFIAPAALMLEHFADLAEGRYEQAFLLMSAAYRASNPSWPADRAAADPGIDVTAIGRSTTPAAQGVDLPIVFYARDRHPTAGSDTRCREFQGTVNVVREGGNWRYSPDGNHLTATIQSQSNRYCPR